MEIISLINCFHYPDKDPELLLDSNDGLEHLLGAKRSQAPHRGAKGFVEPVPQIQSEGSGILEKMPRKKTSRLRTGDLEFLFL